MSINSMTNVAFSRRRDVGEPDAGPGSLPAIAETVGEPAATASSASSALASIATYIPTEVVTLYVSVLAALGVAVPAAAVPATPSSSPDPSAAPTASAAVNAASDAVAAAAVTPMPAFAVFVLLTPFAVWALYAGKAVTAGKPLPKSIAAWPKWEMIAATLAFAVWAAALPSSPFEAYDWFNAALGGIAVLMVSTILGLVAPLFTRTPLANS